MTNIKLNALNEHDSSSVIDDKLCNFNCGCNIKKRLSRMSSHKTRTWEFADYIKENHNIDSNLHNKLKQCYNFLLFRKYSRLNLTKLAESRSCQNHLLCPMCAIVRASKHVRIYEQKFNELISNNQSLKLYYVVLTIANGEDLNERYNHLTLSLKRLLERRRQVKLAHAGKTGSNYALGTSFENVVGGAYSVEVKRGQNSNKWHPHANLLLVVDGKLDKNVLKNEWGSITGDSKIVHCSLKNAGDKGVFVEIFKYALKFSEMSFEDNYHAYSVLKGCRLMGSFGEFRGIKVSKESEIELLDEPYINLFFKYFDRGKKYKLISK